MKGKIFSYSKTLLLASIVLNLLFSAIEAGAGVILQSLALISDALHNVGDAATIGIGLWAHSLARKLPSQSNTFGYRNAESMAILINSISLVVICAYLMLEGFYRLFFKPSVEIDGMMVFWIASVGILVNLMVTAMFYIPARKDGNFYLIFLHSLTDALISVGVAISGLAMAFFQIYWIDSAISVLVGGFIIWLTIPSLLKIYSEIMNAVPKGQSVEKVEDMILAQSDEISAVHHMHIWRINQYDTALEAHVVVRKNLDMEAADLLKTQIKKKIRDELDIRHCSLELELEKNACDHVHGCY